MSDTTKLRRMVELENPKFADARDFSFRDEETKTRGVITVLTLSGALYDWWHTKEQQDGLNFISFSKSLYTDSDSDEFIGPGIYYDQPDMPKEDDDGWEYHGITIVNDEDFIAEKQIQDRWMDEIRDKVGVDIELDMGATPSSENGDEESAGKDHLDVDMDDLIRLKSDDE